MSHHAFVREFVFYIWKKNVLTVVQSSTDEHDNASGAKPLIGGSMNIGLRKLVMSAPAAALLFHASIAGAAPSDQPAPLPGTRPSAATVHAWEARKFGMFIHFGLFSIAGGVWNGQQIDNGYSEQIMANAPIPKSEYEKLAQRFNPQNFDPDAIVALAKAAGMKFIVVTAKHHDGFNLFQTKATPYNAVDGTPYHRDVIKMLADACRRGGLAFGVYYSTIDWHHPGGNTYVEGNSNPITPEQEAFNVSQLRELTTNYGPLSEIWFDMGKPTPAQSAHFASTVHAAQPQTMVSGRVWNHQGDFTVMSDNGLPKVEVEEPWQAPASIYGETWGYRSWQKRGDLDGKVREQIERLVHVVSAGGNYILNIGPEGDGSVVPFEADVLHGIGRWMRVNGEAIYGSGRQPFEKLDFGFATLKSGMLYLFVRDMPADGRFRLPGVVGSPFGGASILGQAGSSVPVQYDAGGAWIAASSLSGLDPAVMPVIAVKLTHPLIVRPQAIAPDAGGGIKLMEGSSAQFQNYNGYGYEDGAKTYKLRWNVALAPGRYRATVYLNAPMAQAGVIDLVIDGHPHPLPMAVGATERSIDVARDAAAEPYAMQVEVTPTAPFTKADALPAEVRQVDLIPIKG
jgi:alpha-L-fucosidase